MAWLLSEIATGLQKLYLLSLDRTPAAELLAGTAHAWLEAIGEGREWVQERDESRVRAAFRTLASTCDRWPTPRQFLAALPDSTQTKLAGPGARPADPPELREALDAVKRGEVVALRSVDDLQRELSAGLDKPDLSQVEADLRRHYGTDRKTLATGETA